jgi:DNA-binding MarR family transcriptional regulator
MCVPAQTHKSSSRTMNPSTHLFWPPYTMTAPGVAVPSGNKFVAEIVPHVQLSVHNCLEALGISLLSEWDVLCFLYRRRVSLMSTQQIARLIGYESVVVRSALDRLRREKLVKRSRAVRGGRLYRILASTDAGRRRCLKELVSLSEGRVGRLLLTRQLKPVRLEPGLKEQPAKPTLVKGDGHA